MQANLVISGCAALTPYGQGVEALVHGLHNTRLDFDTPQDALVPEPPVARVPDYDARALLETRAIGNFDRLTLHVCVAVKQLLETMELDSPLARQAAFADDRISLVLGTSGPLQSIVDFDLQAIEEPTYVRPGVYPNVVFNVPASYAAIRHSIRGSCMTLTDGDTSSLQAFAVAAAQLEAGRSDFALVGGAEEATPAYALYRNALAAEAREAPRPLFEGAALLAMEPAEQARRHGRRTLAGVFGCTHVFSPASAEDGLNACLRNLRRRFGSLVDEVGSVCAEPAIDLAKLGLNRSRQINLEASTGNTGALYGALAVLNALADDAIMNGEVILVLQGADHGPCVALLLQKHGSPA